MASYKPSPTERPAPVSPTNGMRTNSVTSNSVSSTMRIPSMSPRLATHSIMAKSQTSTSQWATGSTKRPNGSDSMMTGPSQAITVLRGPTSSLTSLTYMWHLTTASTPLLKHSHLGSDTCSLVLAGTSKSCNRLWLTLMTGAWPARLPAIASSTMTSQPLPSKLNNTNATLMPSKHSLRHVSPALCSPTPSSRLPCYKTCLGSLEWYVRGGRGAVAHHVASMFTLRHWKMSRDVYGCPL
jgi:hypothetical protein